jgi:hypothetical protein
MKLGSSQGTDYDPKEKSRFSKLKEEGGIHPSPNQSYLGRKEGREGGGRKGGRKRNQVLLKLI